MCRKGEPKAANHQEDHQPLNFKLGQQKAELVRLRREMLQAQATISGLHKALQNAHAALPAAAAAAASQQGSPRGRAEWHTSPEPRSPSLSPVRVSCSHFPCFMLRLILLATLLQGCVLTLKGLDYDW